MAKEVSDKLAATSGGILSFAITCTLMAFLVGVGMGIAARQFYATMYNPNMVLPEVNENE